MQIPCMYALGQLHGFLKGNENQTMKTCRYSNHTAESWQSREESVGHDPALWKLQQLHPSPTIAALPVTQLQQSTLEL